MLGFTRTSCLLEISSLGIPILFAISSIRSITTTDEHWCYSGVMNIPQTDAMDSDQPPRRNAKPTNQAAADDPVRFSTIYRMFEAKSAPSKDEKGVTANSEAARKPTPTNRLKKKKVNASTMTDFTDYDDVNDDDILQADSACGSSTFDQETEMDADWLRQGDVNRSINRRKPNGVTSDSNGGLERSDREGGDVLEDWAVDQLERASGKATQRIPVEGVITDSHEEQRRAEKNQNCPELMTSQQIGRMALQGKGESVSSKQANKLTSNSVSRDTNSSGEDYYDDVAVLRSPPSEKIGVKSRSVLPNSSKLGLPNSPKQEYQTDADNGISAAGRSIGRAPNYQGAVADSDYANFGVGNRQETALLHHEMEDNKNSEVTPSTVKNDPKSISVNLQALSLGQGGMTVRPHDEAPQNQGLISGAGIKCTSKPGNSGDETIYLNYTHATKSADQQTLQEEVYEEVDVLGPRRGLGPHTGATSGSCSSRSSYEPVEIYENAVQSKSQKVNSEAIVSQSNLAAAGNRPATKHSVGESTGDKYSEASDEERRTDSATLRGVQSKQKCNSSTGRNPSEPHSSSNSTEPGAKKQTSSSSSQSTENVQSIGCGSGTCSMLQATTEDQCNLSKTTIGAVQKREVSRTNSLARPLELAKESIRKSMSTNTEATEHLQPKTCAELECQTESFDNVSQPSRSVRDQSTDPDEDSLDKYFWYFGNADREMSEAILESKINESGSYLVRMSQRGGDGNPYTLSVVYLKRIYHLLIRQRSDGKFSIGKEKHEEKVFFSVPDLITFYRNNFVELIGDTAKKMPSGKIQLKTCPRK